MFSFCGKYAISCGKLTFFKHDAKIIESLYFVFENNLSKPIYFILGTIFFIAKNTRSNALICSTDNPPLSKLNDIDIKIGSRVLDIKPPKSGIAIEFNLPNSPSPRFLTSDSRRFNRFIVPDSDIFI